MSLPCMLHADVCSVVQLASIKRGLLDLASIHASPLSQTRSSQYYIEKSLGFTLLAHAGRHAVLHAITVIIARHMYGFNVHESWINFYLQRSPNMVLWWPIRAIFITDLFEISHFWLPINMYSSFYQTYSLFFRFLVWIFPITNFDLSDFQV